MPKTLLRYIVSLTKFTPEAIQHRILRHKNGTFCVITTQCDQISKNELQTEHPRIPTDILTKTGYRYDVGRLSYRGKKEE